jgi:FkbM family methyltransferase
MSFFESIKFVHHLAYHFRTDQSRQFCKHLGLGHGYICINGTTYFQCPSNPVAYSVFQEMAFSSQGRQELKEFIDLSAGCCCFVDVGASGGFFSVLFSASRTDVSSVLSIEPDPGARDVLLDLRNRNVRHLVKWEVESIAVMSQAKSALFVSSGYGAEVMSPLALKNAQKRAIENNLHCKIIELPCAPLVELLSKHQMVPDLLKIDIESYEYELVQSSLDVFRLWKPRIMLELHVALLRARDRDPQELLKSLASVGYRRFRRRRRNLSSLVTEADATGVVRVGLMV